jgi:hypothetical protein
LGLNDGCSVSAAQMAVPKVGRPVVQRCEVLGDGSSEGRKMAPGSERVKPAGRGRPLTIRVLSLRIGGRRESASEREMGRSVCTSMSHAPR